MLPRVDMSAYSDGDAAACEDIGRQLCAAFYHVGFVVLVNHGVPRSDVDQAFAQSAKLFSLPVADKLEMAYTTTARNRGYIGKCQESLEGTGTARDRSVAVTENIQPDIKESFDVGSAEDTLWEDIWPRALMPAFKHSLYALRAQLDRLHANIMQAIALGLNLRADYFTPFFDRREYSLRLLHYPCIRPGDVSDQGYKRAGTHTDYNQITLLLQDQVGGLQVMNSADQWVDVEPEPGAIIVNTGDLMERWSNGLFKSTVHRVVAPYTASKDLPERYSIAYFVKPNREATISCLPTCQTDTLPTRYAPVNCFNYVDAAFKKAGNEYVADRRNALADAD